MKLSNNNIHTREDHTRNKMMCCLWLWSKLSFTFSWDTNLFEINWENKSSRLSILKRMSHSVLSRQLPLLSLHLTLDKLSRNESSSYTSTKESELSWGSTGSEGREPKNDVDMNKRCNSSGSERGRQTVWSRWWGSWHERWGQRQGKIHRT